MSTINETFPYTDNPLPGRKRTTTAAPPTITTTPRVVSAASPSFTIINSVIDFIPKPLRTRMYYKREFIHAVLKIPASQRANAIKCALNYPLIDQNAKDRLNILIQAVENSATEAELKANVNDLITRDLASPYTINVFLALTKVPAEEMGDVIALATRAFRVKTPNIFQAKIIENIAGQPSLEREAYIGDVISLLELNPIDWGTGRAGGKRDIGIREALLQGLFLGFNEYRHWRQSLKFVSGLGGDENRAALSHALPILRVVSRGMNSHQILKIIEETARLSRERCSPEERDDVLHKTLELITPYMREVGADDIWCLDNLVNATMYILRTLPSNRRADLITLAKNNTYKYLFTVINKLQKIEIGAELASVVDYASKLIKYKLSAEEMGAIIQILASLPSDQRADFVRYMHELITNNALTPSEKREIIIQISSITAESIPDVVGRAFQLITPDMKAEDRCAIIKILAWLPLDRRAEFMRIAQGNNMNAIDQSKVIQSVYKSGHNCYGHLLLMELESIVYNTNRLIRDDMSSEDRRVIIGILQPLYITRRTHIVDNALPYITPNMGVDEIIKLLVFKQGVHEDARKQKAQEKSHRNHRSWKSQGTSYEASALPEYDQYYKDLGVTPGASAEKIRAAYKKLALEYHPDRIKRQDGEDDEALALRKKEGAEKFQTFSHAHNMLMKGF